MHDAPLAFLILFLTGCTFSPSRIAVFEEPSHDRALRTAESDARAVGDWRKLLKAPYTERSQFYRDLAVKLRESKVPTEDEATTLAGQAGVDFDARAGWRVTSLYRLAVSDVELGGPGDFVWAVSVVRADADISGLIWVGASTGRAKLLFSRSPK
jgi:hypothetical protein